MKTLKLWFVPVFFFLLTSCIKKQVDNDCFIKDNQVTNNKDINRLSSIIEDYKFIRLETSDMSLIGRQIIKIKKHKSRYYVLSDRREILVYDDAGKYVSKISKMGTGPGEYTILLDFDISENNDIIILDARKIITYDRLDNPVNSRPLNITGFNIKYLDNERFLVCASGEEYVLYVLDKNGHVLEKGLKNKLSTQIGSDVPFIRIPSDRTLFQIGFSNDFVLYDTHENAFFDIRFLCNNECISTQKEDELLKIYGMDYLEKASNLKILFGMASYENHILYKLGDSEKNDVHFKNINNQAEYIVSSNTLDDITYSTPSLLLNYVHYGNADDCFISYFYPSRLNLNNHGNAYNDKYKELIHSLTAEGVELSDENPVLFEFTVKKF